jgi:hypothetical protein
MHGSCLCGDVQWEIEGPFELMSHCHCSRCRKSHGTGFSTAVAGPARRFALRGKGRVERFEPSPGAARCFCGRCGSAVPGDPTGERVFVPAGNLDGDPGVRPLAHIFAASKAPWDTIADSLPRFDAWPPGFDLPVLPDRVPADPPGHPRGSCLCGGVAFVLEGDPILCRNCHCSRCRRGRSAAHASNLGVRLSGLRFTRGEDLLGFYKLPEAKFFAQVFCRVCGSKAPRVDESRDLAIVPLGALDDDPGVRPGEHIFVASKAPWFEIADSLPQYAEYAPA